jgi:acetoin utilization deacetylase AcuC-like enzyme
MRKLAPVAWQVVEKGFAEIIDPGSIEIDKLRWLHAPEYVDAFVNGREPLASSQGWPWTQQIRDGVMAIQAGQLVGARLALEHGIAANIAQGFHHAIYSQGSAYCTFNGLALVAQEHPKKSICVLDCDEHGGNGTEEFTLRLPNLSQCTIHGSRFTCRGTGRSRCFTLEAVTDNFGIYESALEQSFVQILKWRPDLLLYQAGADPHINDPLGSLGMTTEQMKLRDLMVFKFCARHSIPVLFVLAGGYQEPVETKLVPLHVNTFETAAIAFGK